MMCVKLSKIRTENEFYRWCWNILGICQTTLGMNSFQRAFPLSFTSITNKSVSSNGVSWAQIAQSLVNGTSTAFIQK